MFRLASVLVLALLVSPISQARARDARLEAVCEALLPIRAQIDRSGSRGQTPAFGVVKQRLRDWIRSRLSELTSADIAVLAGRMNNELKNMTAACDARLPPQPKSSENELSGPADIGVLGEITLESSGDISVVVATTAIGISDCGYDSSAYVFALNDGVWTLVWSAEQDASRDNYKPMSIVSAQVRPFFKLKHENGMRIRTWRGGDDLLVLLTGHSDWCTSGWNEIYYRLLRVGSREGGHAATLVSEEDEEFEWNIEASLGDDEARIDYTTRSIDSDQLTRGAARHYKIDENGAVRIPPIASYPHDFVDEWLTRPWSETSAWSVAPEQLVDWYAKLATKVPEGFSQAYVSGSFIGTTQHCRDPADAWQVGIEFAQSHDDDAPPRDPAYFLVRWRPLYRMTMLAVAEKPWPTCDEPDREADGYSETGATMTGIHP